MESIFYSIFVFGVLVQEFLTCTLLFRALSTSLFFSEFWHQCQDRARETNLPFYAETGNIFGWFGVTPERVVVFLGGRGCCRFSFFLFFAFALGGNERTLYKNKNNFFLPSELLPGEMSRPAAELTEDVTSHYPGVKSLLTLCLFVTRPASSCDSISNFALNTSH